jgi:hypothetical protein
MKRLFLCYFVFIPFIVLAQKKYPADVQSVLLKAGKNRIELEKALDYFYKNGDPLKIKAINFLVANMDIHNSVSYYWVDSSGKRISFNELDYPTFQASLEAFEQIKKKHPGIHPQSVTYRDIDSMKSFILIDNVLRAFKAWKSPWGKNISFDNFCEYILPYRASVEPLQNWRAIYQEKYAWINDSAKSKTTEEALLYLGSDFKKWFANTYSVERRGEPLPRLGAMQLLHRKKGPCEDIADWAVFALRSQGFPVSNDIVTYWATSSGSHFFNSTLNSQLQPIRFDVSTSTVRMEKFSREPAKVIRITYAKQPNTVASLENSRNIPHGFLQTVNYKDVTQEYWETKDVHCNLFPIAGQPPIVYACVFNYSMWRPTWWGKVNQNAATFTNMCKGVVYLPAYYRNGKTIIAGHPVAVGYNHELVLAPDTANRRTISINEQAGYLVFRPGKKYRLHYWNKGWKLVSEQMATVGMQTMVFQRVPDNALLWLVPEYSERKERPFIVSKDGQRLWF